jgi:glutathione synthase/RimK-type ligase-like ATP-grasp enzyme
MAQPLAMMEMIQAIMRNLIGLTTTKKGRGMQKEMIVILSYEKDLTALEIAKRLGDRNIPFLLLDPGDFPARITLAAHFVGSHWEGTIISQGEQYELNGIKSVLYRRPTHYRADRQLPEAVKLFAENEASKGFGGILRSLNCFWMSHPDALRAAGFKPRQLQRAAALGLSVPRTLITNDPEAARRFYDECNGKMIYKTLHGGNIPVDQETYDAIYTSRVQAEDLAHLDRVRHTSHLFQEYIEKAFELRITVVGDKTYTAAIYSQHADAAKVDFRNGYADLNYSVYELPQEIHQACVNMTKSFDLAYSAIDMAVTPQGEYLFFELNPGGQYHWIEYETGLPITDAIIARLMEARA